MRAVVTGGAGFVGSHLVEALLARGDDVLCIERPGAGRHWLEGLPVGWDDGGIEDESRLVERLDGADAVFHLAALTEARTAEEAYAINTEGTASVVRAASRQARPPRLVFMSTLAAAGPCRNGERLSERTVPYPLSVYGHSKLLAEAVVHAHADRVPAVILRFPSVYGPRERGAFKLFQMVSRGLALTVGGWDREFSLIYVQDAVSALIAAATSEHGVGKTFCIAHPETVTWAAFARTVGEVLGKDPRLISVPPRAAQVIALGLEWMAGLQRKPAMLNRDRVREISQRRWVCDPSPAMREIAFRPRFPVSRGVRRTADWYREVKWL